MRLPENKFSAERGFTDKIVEIVPSTTIPIEINSTPALVRDVTNENQALILILIVIGCFIALIVISACITIYYKIEKEKKITNDIGLVAINVNSHQPMQISPVTSHEDNTITPKQEDMYGIEPIHIGEDDMEVIGDDEQTIQ